MNSSESASHVSIVMSLVAALVGLLGLKFVFDWDFVPEGDLRIVLISMFTCIATVNIQRALLECGRLGYAETIERLNTLDLRKRVAPIGMIATGGFESADWEIE